MPIPETDSVEALAEYWDTHDLTDLEDDLEEIDVRVFVPQPAHDTRGEAD